MMRAEVSKKNTVITRALGPKFLNNFVTLAEKKKYATVPQHAVRATPTG
jgi:hypothetical protein